MKIKSLEKLIKIKKIITIPKSEGSSTIIHTKKYILVSYKTDSKYSYYYAFRK